jgi:hypothetical protein
MPRSTAGRGARLSLTVSRPALRMLRELHGRGLDGRTVAEVAQRILYEGLRARFAPAPLRILERGRRP